MRPLRAFLVAAMVCLGAAFAKPETIAVYPFASQDVMLGVAFADRIAAGFEAHADVFGPAATPGLIPPLEVHGGYLSPLQLLGDHFDPSDIRDRTGTAVLRDALGVDVAIAGKVHIGPDMLTLELFVAEPDRIRTYRLTSVESAQGEGPAVLARKVLDVLAGRFDIELERPDTAIDLSAPYGDYVAALALISGGFLSEALLRLEEATSAEPRERWLEVKRDIELVLAGELGTDAALQAAASLSATPFDEERSIRYFEVLQPQPFAHTWLGTLEASRGNVEAAEAALERAAEYPYGRAARALYLALRERPEADDDIRALLDSDQRGALLAGAAAANLTAATELEKRLLRRLSRVAPSHPYAFERLSFIAFDEDDARAAAEALVVAVDLEPESDLYWTNLGWAYYLLGFIERSKEASLEATQLNPEQEVAWYNLGLAEVVTGKLGEGMSAYQRALTLDPDVNPEAVADLEEALELFPHEPGVHFALATLYDAQGRRSDAAQQFELYLDRDDRDRFRSEAEARLLALRAPPAPIAIEPEVTLGLGLSGVDAAPYRPGDRVYPVFEIATEGFELPGQIEVRIDLKEDDRVVEVLEPGRPVRIPSDVVSMRIEDIGVELPTDLAEGSYRLDILVLAEDGREARASVPLELAAEPELVRRLVGRNIVLRELETGAPFYRPQDAGTVGDAALVETLLGELRQVAPAAEDAVPEIGIGRFEGLGGGALFETSSDGDIRDFLNYLVVGVDRGADLTFVDAYAQWALEGAPTAE